MTRPLVSLAALVVVASPARPVAAQVEINPTLGMYLPIGALVAGGGEERRQVAAAAIGFRTTAWPTRRLGVEGSVAFSPSMLAVTDAAGRTFDLTSGVIFASARAVVSLGPRTRAWSLRLGAGPGLVSRGGSAWANTSGATAPALALAAGVRMPLRGTSLAMRFEVEDYVLSAQFDRGLPTETQARMHHDVMWSWGLAVPIF